MKKELDYYKGFKLCLENALNHLAVADLSKSISYGIAHAHVVLASEEAIKAMLLFSVQYDPNMIGEIKNFNEYFSSHKFKHKTIQDMEHVALLLERIMTIQMSPFVGVKPGIPLKEVIEKIKEGKTKMLEWFADLVDDNKPEVKLETHDAWWKQAETFKKEGFYIDILHRQKDWSGPYKCTEKKYYKGRKVVDSFISKVQFLEENFEAEDIKELYEDLKKLK